MRTELPWIALGAFGLAIAVSFAVQAACNTNVDPTPNHCDGDFNQSLGDTVNALDKAIFDADLITGVETPNTGTDMDCNGVVTVNDFMYFVPLFKAGANGVLPCPP